MADKEFDKTSEAQSTISLQSPAVQQILAPQTARLDTAQQQHEVSDKGTETHPPKKKASSKTKTAKKKAIRSNVSAKVLDGVVEDVELIIAYKNSDPDAHGEITVSKLIEKLLSKYVKDNQEALKKAKTTK